MDERCGPTRVALVEDDHRYRASLEALLQHASGFTHAASFGSARALFRELALLERGTPPWDLVLMDLELPEIDGIEATARLKARFSSLPVIVLTAFEEPATILRAICAGADAYLLKKASAGELLRHLDVVRKGGSSLSGEVARSVIEVVRRYGTDTAKAAGTPRRLDLSKREQEVLRCLSKGLSYGQVAEELGLSIDTVRDHIRRVYKKLQVHSAAEAVGRAVREGLI